MNRIRTSSYDREEIAALIQQGEAAQEKAKCDLGFAREKAQLAFQQDESVLLSRSTVRADLRKLATAWGNQSNITKDYLNDVADSFGYKFNGQSLSELIYEIKDLIAQDGRNPLPLQRSIRWLLFWWEAQGNQITNSLYARDGSSDQPSETVKWLTDELKRFRPSTTYREVHSVLRRR